MLSPTYSKVNRPHMSEQRQEFQSPSRSQHPVSISHLVHTLRNYLPVIALGLACVMVAYVIIATAAYLLSPSQRMTSQSFRLDFRGAERGEYPNGMKFSTNEIISTPVLLKVWTQNNISRFLEFPEFSRSLVVLEANRAVDALTRDYQARLSDPKLTPIDRERIQREFELKLGGINKGHYALHYMRNISGTDIPEELVRKVLNDVLTEWANHVASEQHVLDYRMSVLSPDVVSATPIDGTNPLINIDMLRARALRARENVYHMSGVPGAVVARTKGDNLSLSDIDIRLDELVRFRLEPLSHRVAAGRLDDRAETIRFLESQLAFDQRMLEAQRSIGEASRRALAMYLVSSEQALEMSLPTPGENGSATPKSSAETVMPQLSDSFLERLMQLTASSVDNSYRQKLTDEYRLSALKGVPLQEAVAYHETVLRLARAGVTSDTISREMVDQQIVTTRNEVRGLVTKMNEIYRVLSSNLNASTELITRTGVPTTRVSRMISLRQLALYGVLTAFVALPLLILLCLIHNRVREEDEAAEVIRPEAVEQTA